MKFPELIGVIHLPPLAGAPQGTGHHPVELLQNAGMQAVREALAMVKAGFDAVFLENFGDAPFYKIQVPPETTASMAIIAAAVREAVRVPVGIKILRNDARSALAIAAVTGCEFIRVNLSSGVTNTNQELIEGESAFLLRERARLQSHVSILADFHIKHAQFLSSSDLSLSIEEMNSRSMIDAIVLTGAANGKMMDISQLQIASRVARSKRIPLFLGSGVSQENLREIRPWVDGVIVDSDLREKGIAGAKLDLSRLQGWVKIFKSSSKKLKTSKKRHLQKKTKSQPKKR